ncbi:hypothetical protein GOBAR_AA01696 [Gossypium barbadense]|uniref:Arabidopsis retrotransposon Orf1 C-terminal domain-containing protein n=1 Tax=Gossypium barbadense TaxID=3634 RepID=A0A2P5YTI5_GOSBA|nr:hypothetical protein GOBAR_AA01696 [Gossypium barbadense]
MVSNGKVEVSHDTQKPTKTAVLVSTKRKGATSSTATTEIRHPFLQFPLGPREELFQILRAGPLSVGQCIDWAALEQVHLADSVWALLATAPWDPFFDIIEPTYLEFTLELCSTFQLQMIMTDYDDLGTVQFRLGGLVRQLSVPEFGVALGLYTENFMEVDKFSHLHCHIHYAPSSYWAALILATSIYDPSRFKASTLSPALRYPHALLAHTLTGRRESTSVVNTHDTYFLWSMRQGHGISSMLHMRIIECRCGFDPPQYQLARATNQDDRKDITDNIPFFHENPSSPPQLSPKPFQKVQSIGATQEYINNPMGKDIPQLPCPTRPRP